MYIMIISRGFPTNKYKMNGIFEFDQAKALAKAGSKVVFAAIDMRSIRRWRKWGLERHEVDGVNVYVINIPGGRLPKAILHKVTSIGLSILYKIILKELGKPDILHAHFTDLGYAAAKLKQQVNVPLIITEHSSLINKPIIEKQLLSIAKLAYEQADTLIAVSPALVNCIKDKFNIKSIYVPNIVDTDLFTYAIRGEDKIFNFISFGNLNYGKRMDLTIESFYSAFRKLPLVTLTIFGEGEERSKLEGIIKKYSLESRVVLMGMCSREVIKEKLKSSDCFVLASRSETFGVAYIEALASGVPVIATKCGGPEVFIHEENGRMIPVDDFDALVSAMKYMYENNIKFNREKISAEIKLKFSPECVSKKLLEVYKDVTKF
ncbi:glycosyltransferase [Clostridium bowmanii]|uniref:glycosyltransferase n=1 Tax=Clostridium bowmanii TaxID=132925 RepID=UPI001C0D2F27|nr:glycosyltransferase [Clostridium bowmanii]MBU3190962.1 glycosyltransferase [Clostridium bowmanii]MCA1075419.1 glycosyltransferase [Clostridium bowmanii]